MCHLTNFLSVKRQILNRKNEATLEENIVFFHLFFVMLRNNAYLLKSLNKLYVTFEALFAY